MKGEEKMIQIRPVSDLRNKFPELRQLQNLIKSRVPSSHIRIRKW